MRQDQIDLFMATNANNFPDCSKGSIRKALAECPEHRWQIIAYMSFKNPVVALILSIFLGELGIDRFYIGNIGLGILKLITGGGCGVWWFIDLFLIMGSTRRVNYNKLAQVL